MKQHVKHPKQYVSQLLQTNLLTKVFVIAAIVILGTVLILEGHAATPVASIETENGTLAAGATVVADSSASGGHAVKFSSGGSAQTTNCITVPSACGFPDQTNTGVPAGTTLTPSGSIDVTTPGAVIQNLQVSGTIDVDASNVTIKDTMVINSGGNGTWAIKIGEGVTGTLIEDSTIHALGTTETTSLEYGINNQSDASTKALRDNITQCTECYAGPGTLQDSFADATGFFSAAHIEATFYGGGQAFLTLQHDTLLNPQNNATVYANNDNDAGANPQFGVVANLTITNSMLAGGGWTIYAGGADATNVVITNNRFSTIYYPNYGNFGLLTNVPAAVTWSGNVDDTTDRTLTVDQFGKGVLN